jgi:hypothetical protein
VKDPNRVGQVVGTNPPAGAEITASATVVLQVGVPAPEDNGGGGGGGGGDGGDGGGGGGGDGGGGDDD